MGREEETNKRTNVAAAHFFSQLFQSLRMFHIFVVGLAQIFSIKSIDCSNYGFNVVTVDAHAPNFANKTRALVRIRLATRTLSTLRFPRMLRTFKTKHACKRTPFQ